MPFGLALLFSVVALRGAPGVGTPFPRIAFMF